MNQDKKSALIRYLVCFCVGVAMIFVVLLIQGFFKDSAKENMKILHNAFFATGALMSLFAGLLFVADHGAFLGVGYALGRAVKALLPFLGRDHETYAEYRERKTGKKREKGDHCVLFTGLFFLVVSLVFLLVWYLV